MVKTLSCRFQQTFNMLTVEGCSETARFDLTTRDSYFIIVTKVFTNRILAEDISFTNDVE